MTKKHDVEGPRRVPQHEAFVAALQNLASLTNLANSLALQNPQHAEHLLQITITAATQSYRRAVSCLHPHLGRREEVQPCSTPSS